MLPHGNHRLIGWGILSVTLLVVVRFGGSALAQPQTDTTRRGQRQAAPLEVQETHEQPRVIGSAEPLTYTVGPDDVIDINVRRHPEFSGSQTIGKDGKIQYRFVGDVLVSGLTKDQVAAKLKVLLSQYVSDPEVDVTIVEFRSKVIYVVGEVGRPGRYFLRGETIPVREVVFEAGLPTLAASMRRTMIIHPPLTEGKKKGKITVDYINLYALLYLGDVSKNVSVRSGDILYVPSTVFHKAARILGPLIDPATRASSLRQLAQ